MKQRRIVHTMRRCYFLALTICFVFLYDTTCNDYHKDTDCGGERTHDCTRSGVHSS